MRIVVSDTSALVDLERGSLLECTFRLPLQFVVPDLVYEREFFSNIGPTLCNLGLIIETLSATATSRAQQLWHAQPLLSLLDCFAFALSEEGKSSLFTEDPVLRAVAEAANVDCYDFFWVFDMVAANALATREFLAKSLQNLSTDPRCKLPAREIAKRTKTLCGEP